MNAQPKDALRATAGDSTAAVRAAWDAIAPAYDRTNTPTQMWPRLSRPVDPQMLVALSNVGITSSRTSGVLNGSFGTPKNKLPVSSSKLTALGGATLKPIQVGKIK